MDTTTALLVLTVVVSVILNFIECHRANKAYRLYRIAAEGNTAIKAVAEKMHNELTILKIQLVASEKAIEQLSQKLREDK